MSGDQRVLDSKLNNSKLNRTVLDSKLSRRVLELGNNKKNGESTRYNRENHETELYNEDQQHLDRNEPKN